MAVAGAEFDVCVSISDFVVYQDHSSDSFLPQPTLLAVFDELGLIANPKDLYERYFANEQLGTGSIVVYRSRKHADTVIAFDLHRDQFEQLDLVAFSLACSAEALPAVAAKLRAFFDVAEFQIALHQINHSSRLRKLLGAPGEHDDGQDPVHGNPRA